MVRTVDERRLDIDKLVAGGSSARHRLADAGVDRSDEFPRNCAPNDLVFEQVPAPALLGCKIDDTVTVLAGAAGLANVAALGSDRNRDRLFVGDLRPADGRIHTELAHHAVDN